jgi:hemerythrin
MSLWNDRLLVGVSQIDMQHRKLVEAIDNLLAECSKGRGGEAVEKTLMFVVSYTKEHFSAEEKLQTQYNYPGIAAHKRIHADFISTVTALVNEFKQSGSNLALTGKINKILVDWLIKHISVEDKKVGDHIISSGGR